MKFLNEEDQRLYENLVRELPNKTLQELAKIGFYADFCTKVYNSIPNAGRRSGVPDSRLPRRRTARILWSMLGNSLTDRSIIHTETVLKGKDISLELYSSDDNTEALRSFKVRAGLVDPDVNHDVETYPGLSYKKRIHFRMQPTKSGVKHDTV